MTPGAGPRGWPALTTRWSLRRSTSAWHTWGESAIRTSRSPPQGPAMANSRERPIRRTALYAGTASGSHPPGTRSPPRRRGRRPPSPGDGIRTGCPGRGCSPNSRPSRARGPRRGRPWMRLLESANSPRYTHCASRGRSESAAMDRAQTQPFGAAPRPSGKHQGSRRGRYVLEVAGSWMRRLVCSDVHDRREHGGAHATVRRPAPGCRDQQFRCLNCCRAYAGPSWRAAASRQRSA